jgi:hypothetical protein
LKLGLESSGAARIGCPTSSSAHHEKQTVERIFVDHPKRSEQREVFGSQELLIHM